MTRERPIILKTLELEAGVLLAGPSAAWGGELDERRAALQREIDKLETPKDGQVAWLKVVSLGTELMHEAGHDLFVAVYTAVALFKTRGPPGMVIGLLVVDGLVEHRWDSISPILPRVRARALEWLFKHAADELRNHAPRLDQDVLSDLVTVSERLTAHLQIWLGADAPSAAEWLELLCPTRAAPSTHKAPREGTPTFCRLCRASIPAGYRFCPGCGARTTQEPSRSAATPGRPTRPTTWAWREDTNAPTASSAPPPAPRRAKPEKRCMEVALSRLLVDSVSYPLYVLLRMTGTSTLLERLVGKGADGALTAANQSDMTVDYPSGASVPIGVVVELKGDDFACAQPRKKVRLYHGRDAPLLTFLVVPRRSGRVNLLVEAQLEDELIASEHVWRVCVERSVAPGLQVLPMQYQSALVQPQLDLERLRGRPGRSLEFLLHQRLTQLFTSAALYRWIYLNWRDWVVDLPEPAVSLNEMAFAVVDTGLRSGRIDASFFEALAASFPLRQDWIEELRAIR